MLDVDVCASCAAWVMNARTRFRNLVALVTAMGGEHPQNKSAPNPKRNQGPVGRVKRGNFHATSVT